MIPESIIKVFRGNPVSTEWHNLLPVLKQQKILSAFCYYLKKQRELPEVFKRELIKQQAYNLLVLENSKNIIKLLLREQIKFIPLKGYAVKELYYTEDIRDMGDLDLMIWEEDLSKTIKVLQENGFNSNLPAMKVAANLEHFIMHSVELKNFSNNFHIDLHYRLAEKYYFPDSFSTDFKNSAILYKNYYYPSFEWQIVFLCFHIYKNNWNTLKDLLDLEIMLKAKQPDFKELSKITKKYKIQKIIDTSFAFNEYVFQGKTERQYHLFVDYQNKKTKFFEAYRFFIFQGNGFPFLRFLIFRYLVPFGEDLKNSKNLKQIICKKLKKFYNLARTALKAATAFSKSFSV